MRFENLDKGQSFSLSSGSMLLEKTGKRTATDAIGVQRIVSPDMEIVTPLFLHSEYDAHRWDDDGGMIYA